MVNGVVVVVVSVVVFVNEIVVVVCDVVVLVGSVVVVHCYLSCRRFSFGGCRVQDYYQDSCNEIRCT